MFAMGGMVIEVYTDGVEPKIAYADASAFFPLSNDSEEVDEAVIANTFNQDGKYYTLLKWHEWGEWEVRNEDGELEEFNYRIKNELYEANNSDTIGKKVNLKTLYPDMEPETYFNLENALFIYIKPNEANNKYITSPLGISTFENAHDTLDMLDVMYDFWWNEFRMGKRKVAVPEYMVKTNANAYGAPYITIDDSEELFVALNAGEMEDFAIKDLTVDIRSEQVIESIQALLDLLAMQVGLSVGTFTFTGEGVKTATQVVSENSKSYQTRSSHINTIEDGLRDLVLAVYEVAVMLLDDNDPLKTAEPLERMDISIDFNDGVFNDQQSLLDFYLKAYNAGIIPLRVVIERVFKMSKEDAETWINEIGEDNIRERIRAQQATAEVELGLER
jgi:A118 family predicted phage portal protein